MKFAAHIETRNSLFGGIRLVRTVRARTMLAVSCAGCSQLPENIWDRESVDLPFAFSLKSGPGAFGSNIAVMYVTPESTFSLQCFVQVITFGGNIILGVSLSADRICSGDHFVRAARAFSLSPIRLRLCGFSGDVELRTPSAPADVYYGRRDRTLKRREEQKNSSPSKRGFGTMASSARKPQRPNAPSCSRRR